ncbi:MAG: hypothetical protein V1725_04235 [archaeon]
MMLALKPMNSKDVKHVKQLLKEQFGIAALPDGFFFINKEHKLYFINRDVDRVDFEQLRIDTLGMYFGELEEDGIRLSMDACQLLGQNASKNVLLLTAGQLEHWVKGETMNWASDTRGFVLVRYGNDFLGCGKLGKDKLYNYVSKSRKLKVLNA